MKIQKFACLLNRLHQQIKWFNNIYQYIVHIYIYIKLSVKSNAIDSARRTKCPRSNCLTLDLNIALMCAWTWVQYDRFTIEFLTPVGPLMTMWLIYRHVLLRTEEISRFVFDVLETSVFPNLPWWEVIRVSPLTLSINLDYDQYFNVFQYQKITYFTIY